MEAIGRFVVRERIGVGAHAAVYRAEDPVLDQLVALKVLSAQIAFDPDGRARFIKEARLMRRIESARTATVYDVAQLPDGRPYLVMELADRGTLRDRLDEVERSGVPVPLRDVRAVVVALTAALAAIHDRGVVHRDIKPSNILVRSAADGQPPDGYPGGVLVRDDDFLVLADFGLAKALDSTRRVTVAAGTPAYMAPEQTVVGAPIDGRADIFAASAVIAELLELTVGPPDPWVEAVLERGMARDREDRQPDARGWGRDLMAALDRSLAAAVPDPPQPVPVPVRKGLPGGPVLLAVLAAAVLALAIAAVVVLDSLGATQ